MRPASSSRPAGQVAAALAYVWSPFVYERLVIGHWSLLVGWAALPFAVRSAARVAQRRGAVPTLFLAVILAGFGSPSGGLLVAGTAVAVAAFCHSSRAAATRRCRRCRGEPALGRAQPAAAGWCACRSGRGRRLRGPSRHPARRGGLPADRRRHLERPGGPARSRLVGAGTVPRGGTAPGSRRGVLAWRRSAPIARGLVVSGLVGWVVAMAGALPWSRPLVEAAVTSLPGGGLLRDGQKLILPLVLLLALAVGHLVELLTSRLRDRRLAGARRAAGPASCRWWSPRRSRGGHPGRLEPVDYPQDWARVRALAHADPVPGAVVVLPWQPYRAYTWNDGRTGVGTGSPDVRPTGPSRRRPAAARPVVQGEDQRAAVAGPPVAPRRVSPTGPRVLARAGVRFVPYRAPYRHAPDDQRRLSGADRVYPGRPRPLRHPRPDAGGRGRSARCPVAIADALAFGAAIGALLLVTARAVRSALVRCRHRRDACPEGATRR